MSETFETQNPAPLTRWESVLDQFLGFLAATVLMLLMIVTFIDVTGLSLIHI